MGVAAGPPHADLTVQPDDDPFATRAEDDPLFVARLSETHNAVLNKFPVIERHMLIVTRAFEPQIAPLDLDDFYAAMRGLAAVDGLVFYNGGARAGASQPHKHLQLVPTSIAEDQAIPIDVVLRDTVASAFEGELVTAPALPFEHRLARLEPAPSDDTQRSAERALEVYREMLDDVGLHAPKGTADRRTPGPYNLLMTRRWMMLVPRSIEHAGAISINGLGFAGSFFARNADDLGQIEREGPMRMLQTVVRSET